MTKGINRTAQGYFHDRNPYKLHATQNDAKKDRSRVAKLGGKIRKPRVSTFYTILQDKRKNNPTKFGSVPQGPHTFPFHGIHHGIIKALNQGRLSEFKSVIPSPSHFGKSVDTEIPVGHTKRPRAELAKLIFAKRYKRFESYENMSSRTELQDISFAHTTNKLLQMDPHGSYGYKAGGAGKGALKGKGESSLKPLDQQIDLPKNSGLNDTKAVQTRSDTIMTFFGKL